jgi:hypothetical protein
MSTKNECLKHTSNKNLSVTQEGQLTFPLDKYQKSEIKTAFADAIGKVSTATKKLSTHFLIVKISSFVVFLS